MTDETVLRMEGIRKVFSGVVALDNVDLALARGEVHSLVGENGAGKSTLIKVMTGAYSRDGGEIVLEGKPVNFRSPEDAQHAGVVAVYQEVNLLTFRTVAENIFLNREPRRFGFVDWSRMNREAGQLLDSLGLNIDPNAELGTLNIALRQMVAIARGVSLGRRSLSWTSRQAHLRRKRSASCTTSSVASRRKGRRSSTFLIVLTNSTPFATA